MMPHSRFTRTVLTMCVTAIAGCGDGIELPPAPVSGRVLDGMQDNGNSVTEPDHSSETSVKADADIASADNEHHYFHKVARSHAAEWSYDGTSGPERWGDLSPEYVLATQGRRQSPIDITGAVSQALPEIELDYHPSRIDLVYNGHTVEEIEDKHSAINVDGQQFVLRQFHFHAPSEHTIDGKHAAMEMHLVHKTDAGQIAVIGVLIEPGADNPAFDAV